MTYYLRFVVPIALLAALVGGLGMFFAISVYDEKSTAKNERNVLVLAVSYECTPGGGQCPVVNWEKCFHYTGTQEECSTATKNAKPISESLMAIPLSAFVCKSASDVPEGTTCTTMPEAPNQNFLQGTGSMP